MIWKILTLLLLAAFYGCYFLKMLLQHRQGIRTDQLGRGKTGFVGFVERTLKLLSILLPIGQLIAIFTGASALPAWTRCSGLVLAAIGDGVFAAAVLTMRDNWRAGVSAKEKTELVTAGVYSISRNPAFLGFDLMYLGILCVWFHPLLCMLTAITVLLFHLQIVNVEEPFLQEAFEDAYYDYQKTVNRYLGRKS